MTHELKIEPRWLYDIIDGKKTFEIRNNDRNFQVGDDLFLIATGDGGFDVGFYVKVVYMITSEQFQDGIKDGYCVLGIEPLSGCIKKGE